MLAGGVLASFVGVCAAGLSVQNNLHTNSLNMIQSTQVITKVGCVHPSAQASSIMLCFNTSFVSVTSWGFNNGGFGLVRARLHAAAAWAQAWPELKLWRVTTAKAHGVSRRAAVLAQQGWEEQNPKVRSKGEA